MESLTEVWLRHNIPYNSEVPYTYKFSRNVNFADFEDFMVSWPSTNFSSSKINDV